MSASDRFGCPSSPLTLSSLLKSAPNAAVTALLLALALHASLTLLRAFAQEQQVTRPLTTQFVKRQPRLTKPLEMKKRPAPRRRALQRQMISVAPKLSRDRTSAAIESARTVGRVARPRIRMSRAVTLADTPMEPEVIAAFVGSSREPADKVDMSLEMMDIEALDTGRYQAMVVQDPTDKRNVRGYFHIAQAYIPTVAKANASPKWGVYYNSPLIFPNALRRLAEQMNRYTPIETDVSGTFPVGSASVLETPWLMVATKASFVLNDSEGQILGTYLTHGGFVYAGDVLHNIKSWSSAALRKMFEDALATQGGRRGRDWNFQKLPNDHPLYHCFFDFDGAPPGFDNWAVVKGWQPTYGVPYAVDYVEAITLEGRLVGILDCKAYVDCWGWWNPIEGPRRFGGGNYPDGTRQYQLGINMIIFALTQEGSITKRVMDGVR